MMKKIILNLFLLFTLSAYTQIEKLNEYKYVIVKDKFDFLKESDQYQTSSLTKFLLKKNGFNVFLSNEELPKDLLKNRCKVLTVSVVDDSSMFSAKSHIVFKDCFDKVLYTSQIGKSKQKEYKKAYHESIRRAHESMAEFKYAYAKKDNIIDNSKNVISTTKKTIPIVVSPKVKVNPVKKDAAIKESTITEKVEILYAQSKEIGFQLVNTSPAIIYQILNTNLKDVFILKGKSGILYKSGDFWIAQYYENGKSQSKKYTINF